MRDRLKLLFPLGPSYNAEPADILNSKRAFRSLGYYRPANEEDGAWVDADLFGGIRRFQRDNKLKVDGLMRPGGETENAVNLALREMPGEGPANDDTGPANDNENVVADYGCDAMYHQEALLCSQLPPQRAAVCHQTAATRYGNCLAGKPILPALKLKR